MGTKLLIFSLAITVCNGHISLLGDIISATHKVAGTILEGISHGHHSNVDESVGIKTDSNRQSNYKSTSQPEETIIIVVENGDNPNEYSRSPGNYRPGQHNQKPFFNSNGGYGHGYNEYRPNHNTPVRPHTYGNENFNNNYHNNIHPGGVNNGRPQNYYDNNLHQGHNPNRYPNYPNQENHNHGNHQYPNGNNGFYDQNNGNNFNNLRPNTWNNNGIPSQPPPFNGNNQQNNGYLNPNNNNGLPSQQPSFNNNNQQNNLYPNGIYNNGNANSDGSHFVKKPTTGFLTEGPFSTIKPTENTKTPENDVPLFIPLLPDENKNTGPKRETDDNKDKPAESGEEEFELDVRFKD